MSPKRTRMTLQEAADRLGVHYMTAYRYVRTGRLPAVKEGAEWRVDPRDLERFNGGTSTRARRRRRADYPTRLADRLVAGDEPGAWAVTEDALTAGLEPAEVYLELFSPAMEQIGEGWAEGRLSVADEHQASAIMLRLIGRLGPRMRRRGRTRGAVVLAAPPGDHHSVPVALLTDLLRMRGFRVHDLGADVPADPLADTARHAERLVGVGIGATTSHNEEHIAESVAAVRAAVDAPIVLGGRAVPDRDSARRLGADAWAPKAPEAIAVFESLASAGEIPEGALT